MYNESVYKQMRRHAQSDFDENILSYIVHNSNGHSILYMSLEQFCENAGISEKDAFDFFKAFGTNSFLAFKNMLRDSLYNEVTELGITDRSVSNIASEVIMYEMQNLAAFSQSLDCAMVQRLAQDIREASEVILFTHGIYSPIVEYLAKMLRDLGYAFHITSALRIDDDINLFRNPEKSLVITFGFPRYSKASLLHLKRLQQQGVRIVSVTDSTASPFVFLSEYYFVIPTRSFDYTESYSTSTAFVSILSICLGMLDREQMLMSRQKREELLDDMNMYLR